MYFHTPEDRKPEYVRLYQHHTTENFPQTMVRFVDNIVIATRYISPATINDILPL
ncbi:MAG: hypothetical protein GXO47_05120 [Chlorobi bacterium]|nr:hypothetical protein [Chlorobiota bacterium]